MRKRRELMDRERPRLEIVPMIDIMMFLLVFFVMIVLRMIPDSGVTLSLPGAATAQQGQLHVKDQTLSPDALQTYLQEVKTSHDTNVIVAGDKGTKLQQLMSVMDIVRKAGITDIGIATKNQ
jgi:biopolymer transport protein ExbD